MNAIGERIRLLRKNKLNKTLEKFGEPLGVKKGTVSAWETGRISVTEQVKIAICREYKVNKEWLECGTGEIFAPKDNIDNFLSNITNNLNDDFTIALSELLKTYSQLGEDSRKVILDFAQRYAENLKNSKENK